jgi:aldose sugar dehydrogenase
MNLNNSSMSAPTRPLLQSYLFKLTALVFATLAASGQAQNAVPSFSASMVVSGLNDPWDIAFASGGAMLFTERCKGISVRLSDGRTLKLMGNEAGYTLRADDLFCQGQSGVHGVAVDPAFAQGQRFVYVFSASSLSNPRTNRVIRVRVSDDWTRVTERTDIVADITFKNGGIHGSPGAHSGGRLRFGADGLLYITSGDNHHPDIPQSPTMMGGKVLRVDRDGRAAVGNNAPSGFDPRVYTYGHRNPQGLAFRPAGGPAAGQAVVSEHGPGHTDEVNVLTAGANAGWDPRNRPGLDCREGGYCGYAGNAQTMPMTDLQRFPNAIRPVWINQGRSEGIGPAEFLNGSQWGAWNGALAISLMRDRRIDLVRIDAAGRSATAVTVQLPESARVRSLVQGPDGALWASTDSGQILRYTLR